MKVGILARKSKDLQATSVDRQVADARRFIASQGWDLVEDCVFAIDEGVLSVGTRPQVEALLAAARQRPRPIDAVVLQLTDRMSRDMVDLLLLFNELHGVGLRVWSYSTGQEFKFDTAIDRLLVAISGFQSQSERETIQRRCREASKHRGRSGHVSGNRLYGYDNVDVIDGGKPYRDRHINPEQAPIVQRIFAMSADGVGLRSIAAELNRLGIPSPRAGGKGASVWRDSAIRAILLNETFHGIIVHGQHERCVRGGKRGSRKADPAKITRAERPDLRIVDEETWARVQARFASNPSRPRTGAKPSAMLVGNLRCATCGAPMAVTGGKHRVYSCSRRHAAGASTCGNAAHRPVPDLDATVLAAVVRTLDRPGLVEDVLAEYKRLVGVEAGSSAAGDEEALKARVGTLERELDNLVAAVAACASPTAAARLAAGLDAREQQLAALKAELSSREQGRSRVADDLDAVRREAEQRVAEIQDVLAMDPARARDALRELLDGPAEAVPIMVNDRPRLLVRGRLRAGRKLRTDGDPNGI